MTSIFAEDRMVERLLQADVALAIDGARDARDAARRVYTAVRLCAVRMGMKPDVETSMRRMDSGEWRVSFEAGPYQWAVAASLSHGNRRVLAEPNYSFDLHFSDLA
jgi:hypothetical protein